MPKREKDFPNLEIVLRKLEDIYTLTEVKINFDENGVKVLKGNGIRDTYGKGVEIIRISSKFEIRLNTNSYTVIVINNKDPTDKEWAKFYDIETLMLGLGGRFEEIDEFDDFLNHQSTYSSWREGIENYKNDPDES